MTYIPPSPPSDAVSEEQPGTRRRLGCLLEILETLVLTLVIYLLIHNFVAQPFEVEQNSMVPTVNEHEYVLIDKLTPRFDDYRRGDIVVFQPPSGYEQGGVPFIKRVIGLPGDTVSLNNGRVFVTAPRGNPVRLDEPYVNSGPNGGTSPTQPKDPDGTTEWTVPDGSYFVMGDNRTQSQDSRFFGPISRDLIVGRAWLRYFPLDRIGLIQRPTYAGLPDQTGETGWQPARPQVVGSRSPQVLGSPQVLAGSSATIQLSIARS
jgi:signal peptidase I